MQFLAPVMALLSVGVAAFVAASAADRVARAAHLVRSDNPLVPAATRRLGRETGRLGGAVGRHLDR